MDSIPDGSNVPGDGAAQSGVTAGRSCGRRIPPRWRMLNRLPPDDRLALRLRLARAALLWERVWPAVWPALCGARRFRRPGAVRPAAGICRASRMPRSWRCSGWPLPRGGMRACAPRGCGGWPDMLAARRRIEQASGLPHRPLQALGDHPSAPLDDERAGAVGGAPAAHGGGAAAAARRLAGCRPGAARPVGRCARCWRSCCCWP